jgi:hypothetical protein
MRYTGGVTGYLEVLTNETNASATAQFTCVLSVCIPRVESPAQ